jgi:hypothetical protein
MNLLEALEKKRALESVINDKIDTLKSNLYDRDTLSEILTEIESFVDQYFTIERTIEKEYNSTLLTPSETISDVISYVDGINRKIEVLRFLLLSANKEEIETGKKTDVDIKIILASIERYKELENILVKKIRNACTEKFLDD